MDIDEFEKLKEANRIRRDRCVGFSFMNRIYHYAISGVNNESTLEYKRIDFYMKQILGPNSINVGSDYSFNVLLNKKDHNAWMKSKERSFYKELKAKGTASINFSCCKLGLKLKPKYLPFPERPYSCVEKKIVGYFFVKYFNHSPVIFVAMRPCYFCLPIIGRTFYLKSNKIHFMVPLNFIGYIRYFKMVF